MIEIERIGPVERKNGRLAHNDAPVLCEKSRAP
jgi:hypothetical protein